jgi:hypothetical protein
MLVFFLSAVSFLELGLDFVGFEQHFVAKEHVLQQPTFNDSSLATNGCNN